MNFVHQQSAQQVQRQALSPVLIKSFQLLSLPYPSLVSFLERYSLDNPFLELNASQPVCGDPCFDSPAVSWQGKSWAGSEMDPTPLFHSPDPMQSLQEHLRLQLLSSRPSPEVLRAGSCIIEGIDDRGYFCESTEAVARATHLSESTAQEALNLIQTFSPSGVGAANLRECLLLQADPARQDRAILRSILEGPLEKIERRDLRYFAKQCGASVQDIAAAFQYLSTLSPFPGSSFQPSEPIHYVYPEIEITAANGKLSFSFHSGCDLISVNESLFQSLSQSPLTDQETRAYIREKYTEATALAQELTLRRSAVEKLILFLMREQRDYFLSPKGQLKPITMRQAAEAIGMHPSTISRCVNGRYIQTKDGVIPLKSLFSTSLASDSQEEVSSVEVKRAIRSLIEQESREHPISDQAIMERLSADGIRLSRRTVAKYRSQLGIPGSRARCRKGC